MNYSDLTWNQLRKLATDNDIKVHGKGREVIESELAGRGVDPAPPKKGKASWAPARMLDLEGKMPGYRYRWCDIDPANLRKQEAEGWVIATRENGLLASHDDPGLVHGGKSADTTVQYRDVIVMASPEEQAQARSEEQPSELP